MKNLFFELRELMLFLVRLLFAFITDGNKCVVCDRTTLVMPVCRCCLEKHFNVHKQIIKKRCRVCGKELLSNDNLCSMCKESAILVSPDKVLPLFSYRLWNKELLYLWKIKGERTLSSLFSSMIKDALNELDIKVVIPVPPRKGKIQKNGWDQIDEICRFLEKRYGFKILKLLKRNSINQQKKLNREERLATIKNAYSYVDEKTEKNELKKTAGKLPEKVVLIDDVCTTGATIESCTKILKLCGIKEVDVITLFVVD